MVITSLQHEIKRGNHVVEISCDKDLAITSYPGALSQIITNFIVNSLTHAFSEQEGASMSLAFMVNDGFAKLTFSDNGKGIEESLIPRIFEPFFTTNRKKGGSGLGLNIVYNIVTGLLKGKIK